MMTIIIVIWYFFQLFLKVMKVRYNKHISHMFFLLVIPHEWCKGDITLFIFF